MADIYLGTEMSGSELVRLPPIRWLNGSDPRISATKSKQVVKATMLSGAQRFHFREHHPGRWTLGWEMLTDAELAVLQGLNDELGTLWFQNNWESADWHEVVITSFDLTPIVKLGDTCSRFNLDMTIEEQEG